MSNTNEQDTMIDNSRFAFKKGWLQLTQKNAPLVKAEIMKELGLNSRTSFYLRLNGELVPKVTEVEAIEKIFKKYGVTKIWGL